MSSDAIQGASVNMLGTGPVGSTPNDCLINITSSQANSLILSTARRQAGWPEEPR